MAYRSGPVRSPPRVLVVRPQRAPTSILFALLGGLFFSTIFYSGVKVTVEAGPSLAILGHLFALAFSSIFILVGLHGWLLRVDLSLWEDGMLTMKWTRWPLLPRMHFVPLADVHDVVIESDDGTSKIVVVTKDGPVPLTGSSTGDDLSGKVAEMKAFLGLGATS